MWPAIPLFFKDSKMKKIFILTTSILGLSTSSAFAQLSQTSDITQTGLTNNATVDQTGGQEGISEIDQLGNTNLATVTQSENSVGSVSFSVSANEADIDQTGNNQSASITQVNEITPATGPTNSSTIRRQNLAAWKHLMPAL